MQTARIVPSGTPSPLQRLIAEGRVHPTCTRKQTSPEPGSARGTVSDLVSDQWR